MPLGGASVFQSWTGRTKYRSSPENTQNSCHDRRKAFFSGFTQPLSTLCSPDIQGCGWHTLPTQGTHP